MARAVSVSKRASARPKESKPGPRLALVAGDRTVTALVMRSGIGQASCCRGLVDVGVDDHVVALALEVECSVDVFEAVTGHRDDDGPTGIDESTLDARQ